MFMVMFVLQVGIDVFVVFDMMIVVLKVLISSNMIVVIVFVNVMIIGMMKLNNMMMNVFMVQVLVGGCEQEIKVMQVVNQINMLQVSSNLVDLMSINMVVMISQFLQMQNVLMGLQKVYVQLQNLLLFQYINF